ncbi:glycosyl transferase [Flavobacterium sp. LS1P28]|uniref:glycosyltransferase family protein n=1 Tax=unclassified Flavobacterium TaxID=196869 RepID=UPI000F81CFFA|nr:MULTISPECIES: glycosyltransferase family protein [unclassified Flavobacterium]RTY95569.1 glycosyl transferase [Flavobacterium sp. GSN2]RTY76767.1 glycosyl transferase [Flavobacterium sp. LS1R10]RTY83178.1 glycosyl transferase [Flavobacterium sp. ZB4P23]RTY84302.1 glycosyl transferase [Flavobacterium sp. LS1P28]RTY93051.1 glycosyl transferase [Flavobacterium sp. RSP46]
MKIFYAIQATGNGHISRAMQLYPYLQKFGTVDFFMSGNNASLKIDLPVKYKSDGCSLHYSKCGGLNYWNIAKNIRPIQMFKDASSLPLKNYDVVINDFDSITSLACKLQKVHSVQFGHQASFASKLTPRPEKKSLMGEIILKHYAPSPQYIGLHFEKYDSFILPPIIKDEIIQAEPKDLKHITVYLPSFQKDCLEKAFNKRSEINFHWFLNDVKLKHTIGNITYYPVNQKQFNQSLINCHGVITGGGFETPAEALYLRKKILSIPIRNHYEQECNAAALKKMGVPVVYEVGDNFDLIIENWLNKDTPTPNILANTVPDTLQFLFDTYNSN